jgi:hypothetical protein
MVLFEMPRAMKAHISRLSASTIIEQCMKMTKVHFDWMLIFSIEKAIVPSRRMSASLLSRELIEQIALSS